ncbi:MAG: glycosyltransferase [Alphaproteobacteria bacterium]|nr:glycosyltransferase [Alphaproteobacteria bacterium]
MAAKILHIINGEFYAGAERVQDLLAARLPELGYDLGFACLKEGAFSAKRHNRATPLEIVPMGSRMDISIGRRLAALIEAGRYDAIHTHTPRSALAGRLAARLTKRPVICHIHSPASQDTSGIIRNIVNAQVEHSCVKRAQKLIAVSQSLQNKLLESGHPEHKVALVPNGVPVVSDVCTWQPPRGIWTLGIAALFRPRKGIEILLQALANLRHQGLGTRLRAVGKFEDPVYEHQVKTQADRLGLNEAIDWTGFASDMKAEFAAMDMLVVPSLCGEGLPMVMIEAMASGLPVIGTRVEGIPEVLEPVAAEAVVPAGDIPALTHALATVITGNIDMRAWAERCHARQRDFYSDYIMAAGVAKAYRSIGI